MKILKLKYGTARSIDKVYQVGDVYSTENESKANDLIKSGSWEDITDSVEQVKSDDNKKESDKKSKESDKK